MLLSGGAVSRLSTPAWEFSAILLLMELDAEARDHRRFLGISIATEKGKLEIPSTASRRSLKITLVFSGVEGTSGVAKRADALMSRTAPLTQRPHSE